MPKKSKRQARKTPAPAAAPVSIAAVTPAAPQLAGPARLTTAAEFDPDYTYVAKDLRRIGILAISFVVVLIILSFFI
jgi:small neutral amino acid transporter SnatA (MarC family)